MMFTIVSQILVEDDDILYMYNNLTHPAITSRKQPGAASRKTVKAGASQTDDQTLHRLYSLDGFPALVFL
jgi:hypothetical protein